MGSTVRKSRRMLRWIHPGTVGGHLGLERDRIMADHFERPLLPIRRPWAWWRFDHDMDDAPPRTKLWHSRDGRTGRGGVEQYVTEPNGRNKADDELRPLSVKFTKRLLQWTGLKLCLGCQSP